MTKYLVKTEFIAGDHKLTYSFMANEDITNLDIFESIFSFLLTVFGINNVHNGVPVVDSTILRPEYTELIPLINKYRMSAQEFPISINKYWKEHIILEDKHITAKCEITTTLITVQENGFN